MPWIRSLGERLAALLEGRRWEEEWQEEIRFHIEMETEKNLQAGMRPREARRQARVAFGGVERFREQSRQERGGGPLEDLRRDLRLAGRTLRKSPAFALVAILSLGLGIGANTAIFSVVDAMLFRELPFHAPQELVNLYRDRAQGSFDPMSYPDFLAIQEGTREVLEGLGGYQRALIHRETGSGSETVVAEMVTGNYLSLLGVTPALGRNILPEDHVAPGAHPVVLLGHRYWERAFGGDPGVLGQSIRLNGRIYTVIGVAPESFLGSTRGITADLFAPIMMVGDLMPLEVNPLESRGSNAFFPVGRLRAGVSHRELEEILARVSSRLRETVPEIWRGEELLTAVPTREVVFDPVADDMVSRANLLALALVGLVLLIACMNLTSFLLARAVDRRREFALRLSLGATRGRLIRQSLTETVLLAGLGGGAGFLLALWCVNLTMRADLPTAFPVGLDLSFGWAVPIFALAATLGAGIAIGIGPALAATRRREGLHVRDPAPSGEGRRTLTLSRALVAGQMALSMILLVAAGLLFRSFQATRMVDPGFGREPTAVLSFMIPSGAYSDEEGRALIASIREEATRIPGVRRVGVISNIHLNTVNRMILEVEVDGAPPPEGRSTHQVDFTSVDEGFFAAAGISLLEGRVFDERDRADGAPVAVVNEAMARRFWPGESPLGRTVRIEAQGFPDPTVIGVVSTAKIRSLGELPTPFLYLPYAQEYNAWVSLLAVTRGDPEGTAQTMNRLLRGQHPDLIVTNVTTLDRHMGIMLLLRRVSVAVGGTLATLALLLAVLGLFGVVSYAVARGTREMAIRLSVGADPRAVVGLQLRRGLRLVALGGLVGLPGAWIAARGMGRLLFGVSAGDFPTYLGVAALLALVGSLAAYLPARRASRVDPMKVLRQE